MRVLTAFTIIFFTFISLTKADDIREIEIEGMVIGDSALNFFNRNQINKNFYPKSKKYYYSFHNTKNSDNYDQIQIHLKNNDENFIIQGLRAGKLFGENISECLLKKSSLVEEVKLVIGPNIKPEIFPKYKHSDMYPNSFVHSTQFEFNNGSLLRVYCMDFSKKVSDEKGWQDSLSIEIYNSDYRNFIRDEAYN
tara:strand:- start:1427 stop:2008 length:582 start_codon:yes stop_codon:yes gene_type:complete